MKTTSKISGAVRARLEARAQRGYDDLDKKKIRVKAIENKPVVDTPAHSKNPVKCGKCAIRKKSLWGDEDFHQNFFD